MDFKEYLRKYAEHELKIIGFMDSPFGNICLEFLDNCADICGNDIDSMKKICEMLPRLINKEPLSPITEEDFEEEDFSNDIHEYKIKRCTRFPYIYQEPNGKYYNDRARAFVLKTNDHTHKLYLYQKNNNSKQEIQLPYFPFEEIIVLEK